MKTLVLAGGLEGRLRRSVAFGLTAEPPVVSCRAKPGTFLGSRLSEETVNRPNPVVKIGGKPLLSGICSAAGPNFFIVAAGYTRIAATLRSNRS
jgi:hypothetical protein